jgi:hypothetical protein
MTGAYEKDDKRPALNQQRMGNIIERIYCLLIVIKSLLVTLKRRLTVCNDAIESRRQPSGLDYPTMVMIQVFTTFHRDQSLDPNVNRYSRPS